jgi:hypothetical protein
MRWATAGPERRAGLCLMSNTSQNSSIMLIQVARHTRAHIILWQSTHGRSARPQTSARAARPSEPRRALPERGGVFSAQTGPV